MTYFNDIEPFACDWLTNLYPEAHVDRRSILDVQPGDIAGHERAHFFAGIGGWDLALDLAGWTGPAWTGSCPCQPFSVAGRGAGTADERHLWPAFRDLIAQCSPPVIFGEQVASKAGRLWLTGVRADLEALGYAVGAADLCAASIGSPHIRQRLYWVAYADRQGLGISGTAHDNDGHHASGHDADRRSEDGGLAYAANANGGGRISGAKTGVGQDGIGGERFTGSGIDGGLAYADGTRGKAGIPGPQPWQEGHTKIPDYGSHRIPCADGKERRVEPGVFPLAHGVSAEMGRDQPELRRLARTASRNRTGRLKGFGNAIVPPLAAEFVRAFMEAAA